MASFRHSARRVLGAVAVLPLLLFRSGPPSGAEPPSRRTASGADGSPPALVVLLVVDQMRPDYLERFDRDFEG
ncbi:MAG TPA: hypothetical protein VFS94_12775, partial [Gemmatimonadales bacterium]|nr:hypothetical protein [Gemmatimonadales bacterium]